jgi:hypothetical protein
MASRSYALERGGPKALRLRWGFGMRSFEVTFGDRSWPLDRRQLKDGATIVLPDGSSLLVQRLHRPWYSIDSRSALVVERDGLPVPGSDGDPRVLGRRAGGLIVLFGALRALTLVVMVLSSAETGASPRPVGLSPGLVPAASRAVLATAAVGGLLLLVLGVLAILGRRRPVVIAAAVLGLEMPLSLVGGPPNPVGILIQALVAVHLFRTWKRMAPRERRPSLAQVFE